MYLCQGGEGEGEVSLDSVEGIQHTQRQNVFMLRTKERECVCYCDD